MASVAAAAAPKGRSASALSARTASGRQRGRRLVAAPAGSSAPIRARTSRVTGPDTGRGRGITASVIVVPSSATRGPASPRADCGRGGSGVGGRLRVAIVTTGADPIASVRAMGAGRGAAGAMRRAGGSARASVMGASPAGRWRGAGSAAAWRVERTG